MKLVIAIGFQLLVWISHDFFVRFGLRFQARICLAKKWFISDLCPIFNHLQLFKCMAFILNIDELHSRHQIHSWIKISNLNQMVQFWSCISACKISEVYWRWWFWCYGSMAYNSNEKFWGLCVREWESNLSLIHFTAMMWVKGDELKGIERKTHMKLMNIAAIINSSSLSVVWWEIHWELGKSKCMFVNRFEH